jgi:hypothetical protein
MVQAQSDGHVDLRNRTSNCFDPEKLTEIFSMTLQGGNKRRV